MSPLLALEDACTETVDLVGAPGALKPPKHVEGRLGPFPSWEIKVSEGDTEFLPFTWYLSLSFWKLLLSCALGWTDCFSSLPLKITQNPLFVLDVNAWAKEFHTPHMFPLFPTAPPFMGQFSPPCQVLSEMMMSFTEFSASSLHSLVFLRTI